MPGGDRQDAEFVLARQAIAEGKKQGQDVSQVTVKTRTEGDQEISQVTNVKSRQSREGRRQAESDARTEAEFAAFEAAKDAGKRQGFDVTSAKVRTDVNDNSVTARVESAKGIDNLRVGSLTRQQAAEQFQRSPIQISIPKQSDILQQGAQDDVIEVPKPGIIGRAGTSEGFGPSGEFSRTTVNKGKTPEGDDIINIKRNRAVPGGFEVSERSIISSSKSVAVDLPPPKDDFFGGLSGYFTNIVEDFKVGSFGIGAGFEALGRGVQGKKVTPQTAAEVERRGLEAEANTARELEREFIGSGISAASGRGLGDFGRLGKDIIASPKYFAGSAAGTALTWFSPFAIGKAASLFRGTKATRIAVRPRFDYDPLYGSFADRSSVRFGPYNPTRWENPEALAELKNFRMSVDGPKVAPAAMTSAARTVEAFETVRTRDNLVVETRGGSLMFKPEMIKTSVKVEPIPVQIARETAAERQAARATGGITGKTLGLGGNASSFTSTGPLGLGGLTGVERKRLRDVKVFNNESEILAYPNVESQARDLANSFKFNRGMRQSIGLGLNTETLTGFKAGSILTPLTRTQSRSSLKLDQKLGLNSSLRSETGLSQGIKQNQAALFKMVGLQTTKQTSRTTTDLTFKIETTRTRVPPLPFGDIPAMEQRKRKGKKGRRMKVSNRTAFVPDPLASVLGQDTNIGKTLNRFANPEFYTKKGRRRF